MKTAELTPPLLDVWVAKALGRRFYEAPEHDVAGSRWQWFENEGKTLCQFPSDRWCPSTSWAQGGPIIERDQISLLPPKASPTRTWWAAVGQHPDLGTMEGPTPLIAAMRAKVASVYGETVPDETP